MAYTLDARTYPELLSAFSAIDLTPGQGFASGALLLDAMNSLCRAVGGCQTAAIGTATQSPGNGAANSVNVDLADFTDIEVSSSLVDADKANDKIVLKEIGTYLITANILVNLVDTTSAYTIRMRTGTTVNANIIDGSTRIWTTAGANEKHEYDVAVLLTTTAANTELYLETFAGAASKTWVAQWGSVIARRVA